MDFSRIHFYFSPAIDVERVLADVSKVFPACRLDARKPASIDAEQARISDITRPFHLQSESHKDFDLYGRFVRLYDGFELQRLFGQMIPENENSLEHLHIIFTDLLACTFSDEDLRYHARTVVCGTPSIISMPGIVEAPAKPRKFYLNINLGVEVETAKKSVAGRFLDYGDDRVTDAAGNFVLQTIFFFLAEGKPFCDDPYCRLYNTHWQEDLIRTLEKPMLCQRHAQTADIFNRRLAGIKSS